MEKVLALNRKARHLYIIQERIECGIELRGTEVKSMRGARFSFSDAYSRIENNELWLIDFHIAQYSHGNIHNHEPLRNRKLLVHKQELKRLKRKVDERGLTLIPLRAYLKNGLVKLELGVCKGKKTHDKREAIKDRDMKRDVEREMKTRL